MTDQPPYGPIPRSVITFFGFLAIMGVASAAFGFATFRSSRALERSDDIAACSRQLRSEVDSAEADLGRAENARDDVFLSGIVALARGDDDEIVRLASKVPTVRRQVSDAQRSLDQINAEYEVAAALPPTEFLRGCNDDWPNMPQLDGENIGPFTSCSEAAAAGFERMERGEAGYSPALDGDGDGIACE